MYGIKGAPKAASNSKINILYINTVIENSNPLLDELRWEGMYFFEEQSRVGYDCILTFRNAFAVPSAA